MEAAHGAVARVYEERRARFTAAADRLSEESGRVSGLRTAAFVVLVGAGLFLERGGGLVAALLIVASLVAFIALIVRHRRLRARERWQRDRAALNEQGLRRLERAWDQLPMRTPDTRVSEPDARAARAHQRVRAQRDGSGDRAAASPLAGHPYAGDLDVFGYASLVQLLGPGGSVLGDALVDEWLLTRAPPDVVRRRQSAAAELATLIDLRERLAVFGRRSRDVPRAHIDRFLRWVEREPWLLPHRGVRLLAWLLPLVTAVLLVLHLSGLTGPWWVASVVVAAAISLRFTARIHHTFDEAFGREGMFDHFPELIGTVADAAFDAPLLRELHASVRPDGASAQASIGRLRRIMHHADVRASSMHFIIQLATLWDFHVLAALERWQQRHGHLARGWLHATAEVEALSALGTLAHDQPDWTFAELRAGGDPCVEADALAHPLLPDDVRVPNDVAVGPPGTFLLVTGSNMSGKSTLLRAIGVNVVLAQAGAPCCARRFRLAPLDVLTSIQIQDSLARGVSHFMAELERLKQIVDAADAARAGSAGVLYLLDEILHGTNTAERRIAARRVIKHLLAVGAIGAVTTHDLELVDDGALAAHARLVHFQETFSDVAEERALSFDYRLREGLATSTNALKLMRYVGLPDE